MEQEVRTVDHDLCIFGVSLERYCSVLLVPYVMWSGVLESLDPLLSHPTITLAYHVRIILISTLKHCIIIYHYITIGTNRDGRANPIHSEPLFDELLSPFELEEGDREIEDDGGMFGSPDSPKRKGKKGNSTNADYDGAARLSKYVNHVVCLGLELWLYLCHNYSCHISY